MKAQLHRFTRNFKRELDLYRRTLRHPRTPRAARFFLGAAVTYALSPIDLIPDFIPVLGHLDDLLIISLLAWLGLRLIPADVLAECRIDSALIADPV
jgi:uncharacterized membrane protein YkvA (DUF1232 family)